MELSKNRAQILSTLANKKFRDKYGLFIAEGDKCVKELLGGFQLEYLISSPCWEEANQIVCSNYNEKYFTAKKEVIGKISSLSTPPDVIGVFRIPENSSDKLKLSPDKLYLMLDDIQDPGNLGTIIRTADWFGINTIIASRGTADVYNPKTVQSTMGSLKRVHIIYGNLEDILDNNQNLMVYGTLLNGQSIYDAQLSESGIIIMGNEGKGIGEKIRKRITIPLLIPPFNNSEHAESLNVAIATGIILSCFRNNRLFK